LFINKGVCIISKILIGYFMHQYILFFLSSVFFFFVGCSGSSDTNDISILSGCSTDSDINHTISVVTVPHKKSSIPMLGILISYDNIHITSDDSIWNHKLFGYNEHELNHYYKEVSNNQFHFTQASERNGTNDDGIVSVSLSKNHPNSSSLSAVYPDLHDALISINNSVDFSIYDTNSDAKITPDELLLTFFIAGYEKAYNKNDSLSVYAHVYCLNIDTILDGVSLANCQDGGNFTLLGERHNQANPHDASIGIIAHELGHATFNLPDLYNTSGGEGGIGYFGLMGGGVWGQVANEYAGDTPVHFTAWSKIYNGWITPSEQKGFLTLNESSSTDYNVQKITVNQNCYYLLENRNNSGYDRGLYTLQTLGSFNGGLAIWKIDNAKLTPSNFNFNNVNSDDKNRGVDLVEAVSGSDTYLGTGKENALFYYENVSSFETKVTDIGVRNPTIGLTIH
jgi:M6 family metalloprotease-like protein